METGGGGGGGFHVGSQGAWYDLSVAGFVGFLETYGWFILAGVVATSFLLPSFQRFAKKVESGLYGEDLRRREAKLDKQREQVRKKQAEAFEKRVREIEEQTQSNATRREEERSRRLDEINERAARLGLQPRGEKTGSSKRSSSYNPLMGSCELPRHRPSGISRPRGG
ncbi:hypothetical protein HOP50_01g05880 [Chloropicon primus]|uniref:Selenoprotein S n=1 Tax=Chloropicon primus TaxID=1764295 RepID=A0A5B8MD84_9CHLO|nr:hypothetical protein A3770_01p06020 [Chloropicon primus]UPQ97297.1 hypothetical protein HOP50_01g05880 [Chloropicon primus]|eukprot:QDZ18084.1 hypothetical protein A3770_01p06020 [Chloropicon primus]